MRQNPCNMPSSLFYFITYGDRRTHRLVYPPAVARQSGRCRQHSAVCGTFYFHQYFWPGTAINMHCGLCCTLLIAICCLWLYFYALQYRSFLGFVHLVVIVSNAVRFLIMTVLLFSVHKIQFDRGRQKSRPTHLTVCALLVLPES
jgi:hypothetical protein